MGQQLIADGQSAAVVRTNLNANFTELFTHQNVVDASAQRITVGDIVGFRRGSTVHKTTVENSIGLVVVTSDSGTNLENLISPMPNNRNTVDAARIRSATLICGGGTGSKMGTTATPAAQSWPSETPPLLTTHYQADLSSSSTDGRGYNLGSDLFGPTIIGGNNNFANCAASSIIGGYNAVIRWSIGGHAMVLGGDGCLIAGNHQRCVQIHPGLSVQYECTHALVMGGLRNSQNLSNNVASVETFKGYLDDCDFSGIWCSDTVTLTGCNRTHAFGAAITGTNIDNGLLVGQTITAVPASGRLTSVRAHGTTMTISHSNADVYGNLAKTVDTQGNAQQVFSGGALHNDNYAQHVLIDKVQRVAGTTQSTFALLLDRGANKKIYGTVDFMLTGYDRVTNTKVGSVVGTFSFSMINDADGGTDGTCRIWNSSASSATSINIATMANQTLDLTADTVAAVNTSYLRLLTPTRASADQIEWHLTARLSVANSQS